MITQNYLTLPLYVPRICRLWTNWPEYLFDYLLRRHPRLRKTTPAVYRMRTGARLIDTTGTLAGTMAVVFVREEYGRLERFRTILDVGANLGCFALYAAQRCPDAKIYCYEPERRNFESLVRNLKINELAGQVSAFQCAVASSGRRRELAVTEESLRNSFHIFPPEATRETVDCMTLPNILETQKLGTVDLLKMNCEGAEYEILEGCSDADLRRITNIRLEYHNMPSLKRTGEDLAKFLQDRGYRIERFTRYLKVSGFIWATRTWIGSLLLQPLLTFAATVC
jgi:FkbM family methyltransferase